MTSRDRQAARLNPHIAQVVCSKSGNSVPLREFSRPLGRCECCDAGGSPVLIRYRWDSLRWDPSAPLDRSEGIWRYAALLPVKSPFPGYASDVGLTPSLPFQQLGAGWDVDLWIKSEGANPSGSFKDRGAAVAIALGHACGAKRFCLPTQGNAGIAAALFSSRLGLAPCLVYMPEDYRQTLYHRAASFFGAEIIFFGANIAECGGEMRTRFQDQLASGEFTDLSTFYEPGRLEGKKTLGLEIAEQFCAGSLPDFIVYPTGGGTGLVGIWKAFEELREMSLLPQKLKLPRMVVVQSDACCPVVASYQAGDKHVSPVRSAGTVADGLNVPRVIMGHEILRVLRESDGTAVAVGDSEIVAAFHELGRHGLPCSYEGAATWAALAKLRRQDIIAAGARVLLINTSAPAMSLVRRPKLDGIGGGVGGSGQGP